jgi:hypothetical protein
MSSTDSPASPVDQLVPDPQVAEEFGIALVTIWRWDRSPVQIALGWPPRIKIRRRNYRNRSKLEEFKANVLRRALHERNQVAA